MFDIALVNPPFASLKLPSLALTQLKSVLASRLSGRVTADVIYLNHDFAARTGVNLYQFIAVDMEAPYNGFGDWFFRQVAFPELPDNTETYFQRFFPHRTEHNEKLKSQVLKKRDESESVLRALIERHRLHERGLVGLTSMFSQNMACFALARLLKSMNPAVTVVMGGANCEAPMGPEIVKNVEWVDYVFSGSALVSFPDFVEGLLDGDTSRCDRISGIFSKNDTLVAKSPVGEERPLDAVLDLDYGPFLDALEDNFTELGIEPILLFETSRGCWWGQRAHCTFCGLNGQNMNYRSMSPERARETVSSLFRYSDRVTRLQSVDNIMPKHYPKEVFDQLQTPQSMSIFYEVKADLTDEQMAILSRARVREVQPGIEALATSTLKLMRKGTTAFQNLRFLQNCVRHDIYPDWSILVGFPGEGNEVYEKYVDDIPRLVHLPPPSGVYPVRPDRFSPYHSHAEEYGLELHPADFYELVYPFSKESLRNLAYFFRDFNFGAEYFQVMVQWFDQVRNVVEAWRRSWKVERREDRPMLYLDRRTDGAWIHDSRSGERIAHPMEETQMRVLEFLAEPRRKSDLVQGNLFPNQDPLEALEGLRGMGALFEEGERIVSLVLPEKPEASGEVGGWSWAS